MKVLLAIDSSPSSDRIFDTVVVRPWPPATEFGLVNVVDLRPFERLPAPIEDIMKEAQELVSAGARKLCGAGYQAATKVLQGHPRTAISAYAKEWGADLILIGSHGHGAIGRFLLGSVAQGVLRTAPCSVEIVRTPPRMDGAASAIGMKILLATDGSDCSVGAVHAVANHPWPEGTVFRVLSVEELMVVGNQMDASSLSAVYPASLLEELVTQAHERATSAAEMAKSLLVRAGRKLTEGPSTPLGDPRGIILDTAKEWPADLIVVGSHGRRGLDRYLMGSVSEAVAVHAQCSVRVIRGAQHAKNDPYSR